MIAGTGGGRYSPRLGPEVLTVLPLNSQGGQPSGTTLPLIILRQGKLLGCDEEVWGRDKCNWP